MRILYGITANGNGHLARSGRIVRELRARGHEVALVVSGEEGRSLLDARDLEPYVRLAGFRFAREAGGGVDLWRSVLASRPLRFLADLAAGLPRGPFDLAVTDYEPVVAWGALLRGIPSAGVCRMYAFTQPGVPAPPAAFLDRLGYRWLAPARVELGIHLHPYAPRIVPPFVPPRPEVPEEADLVLAYLPWEEPGPALRAMGGLGGLRFLAYGLASRAGDEAVPPNVTLRPEGRRAFLEDLARASGVLANAGFALAGEALSWGKRLVLRPLAGQPEQEHNARELEGLGLAASLRDWSAAELGRLLAAPRRPGLGFPDPTPAFVAWLEAGAPDPGKAPAWSAAFWGKGPIPAPSLPADPPAGADRGGGYRSRKRPAR